MFFKYLFFLLYNLWWIYEKKYFNKLRYYKAITKGHLTFDLLILFYFRNNSFILHILWERQWFWHICFVFDIIKRDILNSGGQQFH
jgi:hypothetical protein